MFFAACAALGFAAYVTITKRALQSGTVIGGVILSLTGAWVVVAVAVLPSLPHSVSAGGLGLFVGAGLMAAGLGTFASISGVHRLGPSTSVPVEEGAYPAAAVAIAVVALGEHVTLLQVIGILAIVAGGVVLSRVVALGPEGDDASSTSPVAAPSRLSTRVRSGLLVAVAFPVIAGMCFAGADVVSKVALDDGSDALAGSLVNISAGLIAWVVAAALVPAVRREVSFAATDLFLLGGAFLGFGLLALYRALQLADVSVVAPILSARVVIVFALSGWLLRDIERIRGLTVAGGLVVIAGTILVVMFGPAAT